MNAAVRVLLVLALAGTLLTGCAEPNKPGRCPELDPALELGSVTLTKQDKSYQEDSRKRFGRLGLPPLENPALGEQALLDFGNGDGKASATVVARKGIRVVEIRYAAPAGFALSKGADPKHYAEVKAVVLEMAGEVLR